MLLKSKISFLPRSLKVLTVLGASLAFAGLGHAQGTDAGRTVSNTFTLDYSVNSVPQTQITNEDGTPGDPDGPTEFTVDRLIDLTVIQTNSPQVVAPGTLAANAQLTFDVTNTGNDNQSYSFSLADIAANDDFSFVPGTELITVSVPALPDGTPATTFTLSPVALGTASTTDVTPDIPAGVTFTVTVSGDIPAAAANADVDDIALVVETRDPVAHAFDPATPTAGDLTTGVNGPNGTGATNDLVNAAQNVFADDDSDSSTSLHPSGDIDEALNGVGHDVARLIIATPNVSGEKTVVVVATDATDPECANFGFEVTPSNTQFAVPGACVEYIITVQNTGAEDLDGNQITGAQVLATNIDVTDILPAELVFVAATAEDFTTAPTDSSTAVAGALCDGAVGGNCVVSFTGGELAAPANATAPPVEARIRIRAFIQ